MGGILGENDGYNGKGTGETNGHTRRPKGDQPTHPGTHMALSCCGSKAKRNTKKKRYSVAGGEKQQPSKK